MTTLEYAKLILDKVSFEPRLFSKEFYKAVSHLLEPEIFELYEWCISKFGLDFTQTSLRYSFV